MGIIQVRFQNMVSDLCKGLNEHKHPITTTTFIILKSKSALFYQECRKIKMKVLSVALFRDI